MKGFLKIRLLLVFTICSLVFIAKPINAAEPWFTGPLLAPAGNTIPNGHFNLEPYLFYTNNIGSFNRHGKLVHTRSPQTTQVNPVLSFGLTERMDFQLSLPYAINHVHGITRDYIGDVGAIMGFQAFAQGDHRWRPSLRITLQEQFPTGRFDKLNPILKGTDGTGMGSYQTSLTFNFQHQILLWAEHYLCSLLSLNYTVPSSLTLQGISTYGGTPATKGSFNPRNLASIDIAEEFSVTQNWALVMEAYYVSRQASRFHGFSGFLTNGFAAQIGAPTSNELSLAPAIEYNFSANYGIIAGVWFAVHGKSSTDFISTVVAFNAYW
jgi:hypothetical protein